MIALSPAALAFAATLAGLWLIAATWALAWGLRRGWKARAIQAEGERVAALLARAPAIPLQVAPDGRITADPRLADWLGLNRMPRFLVDLTTAEAGLVAEDAALLVKDATSSQRAARGFVRPLHVAGSQRVLLARGQPDGAGGVTIWIFDQSEARLEIERLEGEVARLARGLEAIAALIEAAPFPMWHRGPDLRLALVNAAYVRAVEGENAADVVARGLELVEGRGGTNPLSQAAEAREAGIISVRTEPATIAGQRRMIRVVDVPIGDAGVAGYAVDVEELEEARGDLQRFARAQRDLLDRLSAGVAMFGADRGLVFYNHPFLRLFAMEPEWLAESPEFDRVLDRMRETNCAPEIRDFPRWKGDRRGWFLAEEAVEEAWLLPGGTHLRVIAQPLPDGGLLLIFEDRTEQVQLASARDTLLRVRTATFDNLFEAVGVFAADGRLHLWNNRFREVWGLREETLDAHPRVDALVEAVGKRLANPSRAGLIRELVRIATVERQQRSGRVALTDGRHFEFAAVPLPDGNALFTMLDITASRGIEAALRDRNEALEAADKLKTAFVANISYELRVPLTSIAGFAEMLAGGYAGALGDTAKEYVEAIIASVQRLTALIEDVLDLTQGEAGSLPLAAEPVDLMALTAKAIDAFRDAAAKRRIDLAVDLQPTVGTIVGDERRLRQSLDHLLRNAVHYTPEGGRVLVVASGTSDAAELVVSDDGEGIDPAAQQRMFDPVARAEPRGDGRPALGLGLPLTRQFIEAHGGTMTLASEPGQGTAIIVRLPRERA